MTENKIQEVEYPQIAQSLAEQTARLEAATIEAAMVADQIIVSNDGDEQKAIDAISNIKRSAKEVEESRKKITVPLNRVLDRVNETLKPFVKSFDESVGKIKGKILSWHEKKEEIRQQEEARRQKEFEEARKKAEAEELKRAEVFPLDRKDEPPVEMPAAPLPLMPTTQVRSEEGNLASEKKVWDFEIVDIEKIDRRYLNIEVNRRAVLSAIKDGVRTINGLKLFERTDIAVRTR